MGRYLLFRLYGPMCSWGDVAVGEVRPSEARPSKSAVLGLLAGALGIRRDREEEHRELDRCLRFAVREDSSGLLLADYHTVQSAKSSRKGFYLTRGQELADSGQVGTLVTTRQYRMDALYTACITLAASESPVTLDRLAEALERPVFVPYLGRKACPPALPMQPQIIEADDLAAAFATVRFADAEFIAGLDLTDRPFVHFEDQASAGLAATHVFFRRDAVLSRKRWQFQVRREHRAPTAGARQEE